jgi:alkylated DNA repair dioxygenase AlkB
MQRIELRHGARVLYAPGFVPRAEAERVFTKLLGEIAWEQGAVKFFGKLVHEPRLSAWIGDHDYTYSGRTVTRSAWTPLLLDLKERVERAAGAGFNAVLVNRYRSGRDSMGLHADDEPELGENPIVASLSFGASRRFVLEPKRGARSNPEERWSFELGDGDLLVMAGTCQHFYRHGVPKQPRVTGERINLTFRRVLES